MSEEFAKIIQVGLNFFTYHADCPIPNPSHTVRRAPISEIADNATCAACWQPIHRQEEQEVTATLRPCPWCGNAHDMAAIEGGYHCPLEGDPK